MTLQNRRSAYLRRLGFMLISIAYSGLFIHIYVYWASPLFSYLGLTTKLNFFSSISPALFACAIPTLFLRLKISKFSDFFIILIYFIIYVPSTSVVFVQDIRTNYFEISAFLLSGLLAMLAVPRILRFKIVHWQNGISPKKFWQGFFAALLFAALIIVVVYGPRMALVGFDQVYEQRSRAAEVGAGRLVNYLVTWMGAGLNPYLIANGILFPKRRWMLVVGLLGQVFVFSIFASKIALVSTLAIVAFGFLYKFFGRPSSIHVGLSFVSLLIFVDACLFFTGNRPEGSLFILLSQIFMRGLAIQGAMLGIYADFFSTNPQTLGSHITGVNMMVPYPYADPIGVVIGKEIVGGDGFNANSSFFATDGVAGFGLWGIPFVGLIVGGFLSLADRFVSEERMPFACTASVPFVFSTANVSIFTSIITGGGLILIVLLALGARDLHQTIARGRLGARRLPTEGRPLRRRIY